MRTIDGSGGFDLADGALKGLNIAAMARAAAELTEGVNLTALQSAVAQARGPAQQTDFSEFLSDFSIADGLVSAPTIKLSGPYLNMTGKGTVNLAEQTINISLSPRATTTIDGEGGRAFSAPMKVGGTFAKPTIGIDVEALARSGLQRTLQNVLTKDADGQEEENGEKAPAQKILEGILGGQQKKTDEQSEDEANAEPSTEDVLIKEGLGLLFGKKDEPEEEETEEEPQQ